MIGSLINVAFIGSVTLFFKVRNRIKKAFFKGKTLDELKELFIEKFRVEDGENEFGIIQYFRFQTNS
jgi:hypothetical protein